MKIISLIVRRPDLDRATFARHYDERHAPLALRLLPEPFAGYRRNHVLEPEAAPFDCISEFCFATPEAGRRILDYFASDASRPLHEDEARFMDTARNAFYEVEEEVVRPRAGGASDGAVGVWAVSAGGPVSRAAAVACIHNHVRSPSRKDAPGWRVLTELWYPSTSHWVADREAWKPVPGEIRVVRIRESVSVPRTEWSEPRR